MIYLKAFIVAGIICTIGQIILDKTKLTPGHITAMFVVIGALLDIFNIYDKIVLFGGGGALVPITSFGHLLIHGAIQSYHLYGISGLLLGMFDLAAAGITFSMIIAFVLSMLFTPKD